MDVLFSRVYDIVISATHPNTMLLLLLFCALLSIIPCTDARDYPKCDYHQSITHNQTIYITSPRYDKNYLPGTNCRWRAESPENTIISLSCEDFNVPSSTNCAIEKLLFSPTGRADLADGNAFCGSGKFVRYTFTNQIAVSLQSKRKSRGGRFFCEVSVQPSCSCGRRQETRIVGGTETLVNEFTMMASLFNIRNNVSLCGATIISTRYVVTAAHCVPSDFNKAEFEIRVGEHNFEEENESDFTNRYTIERTIAHADYSELTQTNDIALIQTAATIIFNTGVGPVCLPFKFHSQTFENKAVTVVGWGSKSFSGPVSPFLQKADLTVVSNAVCKRTFEDLTDQEICTQEDDRDSCQYDSGGPLLYTDDTSSPPRLYLAGIVNYGIGCASGDPSVATRVTSYLDWIKTNTPGTAYCNVA